MEKSKGKIQIGIYLIAILMMGVVGIASSLGVVAAQFPEVSMTNVQVGLISVPCIVIMVVTLLMGKLMQVISKKTLTIIAIVLFLVGGIGPAFMSSFSAIIVLRGVFGAGVGILQVVSTALVAENFEGAEREKVQGNLQAFQMLGCAIMVFVGGWLGAKGWNTAFYVHALALVSLVAAIVCIPNHKPVAAAKTDDKPAEKAQLTGKMWVWMIVAFFVFCTGQIYSNSNAFLVADKGIGDSAASGLGTVSVSGRQCAGHYRGGLWLAGGAPASAPGGLVLWDESGPSGAGAGRHSAVQRTECADQQPGGVLEHSAAAAAFLLTGSVSAGPPCGSAVWPG